MRARAFAEVLRPEPMTLEAWADLGEDEPGELVDGRLEEEEVPSNLHELVVAWLLHVLKSWAAPRRALVFGSEHKLGVSERCGRKPDVCMYAPGERLGARASLSRTPPALIFEVLSTRARDVRRDRLEKVNEYARFGVRWYGLLDPEARVLELLELGPDGRYVMARSVGEGTIALPSFEGLALDLDALWSETELLLTDDDETAAESG
ncbi:Uma2 family endonuclease [Sorangium sp. So ce1036]|uniref:Uma2 family endonuclease n=1 Tax=Sorangium sp. So ce1036 TaxID=3133328 RepID=UPI003F0EB091